MRRKAYSYLRFSTPEQSRGASRRRQSEAAEAYAREHDLDLDETLRDEGVSAFKGKNRTAASALGAFLAKVDAGAVSQGSVLLVESFDRLSREQVLEALQLLIRLVTSGITVVTLLDRRVYDRESLQRDQTALIVSIVTMIRAHEESATKSRRVGDAWNRKRAAARETGQAMTARCPGWLRLVGGPRSGRYEVIDERAKVVVEIFQATIAGDGRRTITKRFNARGETTWGLGQSRGAYWHDSYVTKTLNNPAVYGSYVKGDETISGYFPPVVDEQTFWRAQAATANRSSGRGRTSLRFNNMLKNLARCESCGGSLILIDKGKRSAGPSLTCSRARSNAGCDARRHIPYKGIESLLVHMTAHFADATMFAFEAIEREAELALAAAEERKANLTIRYNHLLDALEGIEKLPGVSERLHRLAAEIRGAESDIAKAQRSLADSTDLMEDIEDRVDVLNAKLYADDPVECYRGRAEVHARLCKFLDHVLLIDGGLKPVFKPEFADIDAAMVEAYKPVRPVAPPRQRRQKRATPTRVSLATVETARPVAAAQLSRPQVSRSSVTTEPR